MTVRPRIGAWLGGSSTTFRVWASEHERVEWIRFDRTGHALGDPIPMHREHDGYFALSLEVPAGTLYRYRVDGQGPFPDPASRSQPLGVHGPSEVDDPTFAWSDGTWNGIARDALVLYETHVGTATPHGTFTALIELLPRLRALGVTALELMPVASAPGCRNWGYDGVSIYAPSANYGGPRGLRALVDAAHAVGLAVILDVVYNHFGPDGNYLRAYSSRYFDPSRQTPWGDAIRFDDAPVREFFLANAEMWIREYHLDGLRFDATHAIEDHRTPHLLSEIATRARAAAGERSLVVIAEDERNDARLVRPEREGGLGLDGVWSDDFHHQVAVALTGEREGYFADFTGSAEDLARTIRDGWFYRGQRSEHAGRERGTDPTGLEPPSFVYCIENHDQVGNHPFGRRLGMRVSPAAFRAASALLLLSPHTPLLFQGQEWNAQTPFLYFTDHPPELGRLVTEGRRAEFRSFAAFRHEEIPDPQAEATFTRSRLDCGERERPEHAAVEAWYRTLLQLRATHPALRPRDRAHFDAHARGNDLLVLERRGGNARIEVVVSLRGRCQWEIGDGRVLAFSEHTRFGGSFAEDPREVLRADGPFALVLERG